ncbi:CGNR zinc finger domain-containing protein [Allobranchiibius sp. CTAmp26]|uniref:CGNR zinc finger domain-containing protein n=1 Tax=Allobranchiibius sp. CTAmp26 TaxID=2815214 RepID=UPI001AA0F3C1|nr:CGNR zinc finger domain-containing protein [Allobranchiibius sp. CTAmp26]MBO1754395.1 CGNR zinc finger domain-containing protein [Allobranchiibius sp. CTAmp26]
MDQPGTDERLLLDLLNSTPVIGGQPTDELSDASAGHAWLTAHGRPAGDAAWRRLRDARDALQGVVRGDVSADDLAPFVRAASYRAGFSDGRVTWSLTAPAADEAAAAAVLAWDAVQSSMPGRLRPCANPDCRLFLLDRSKPNSARWCSMASCGNRMKARRHYERTRGRDDAS